MTSLDTTPTTIHSNLHPFLFIYCLNVCKNWCRNVYLWYDVIISCCWYSKLYKCTFSLKRHWNEGVKHLIEQACQLGKTNSREARGLLHRNSWESVTRLKGAVKSTVQQLFPIKRGHNDCCYDGVLGAVVDQMFREPKIPYLTLHLHNIWIPDTVDTYIWYNLV